MTARRQGGRQPHRAGPRGAWRPGTGPAGGGPGHLQRQRPRRRKTGRSPREDPKPPAAFIPFNLTRRRRGRQGNKPQGSAQGLSEREEGARPTRSGHLCPSPGRDGRAQRSAGRATARGRPRPTGLCLESLGPRRPRGSPRSQQDVVLQRPGHAVDDEPPVVAEGGEEPGVG